MTDTCLTAIQPEILDLINSNKTATICCASNNKPYCFNCFYSVLEDEGCLVFKSSESTKHMQILSENNAIAGTIIPSEFSMTKIQGIQFEGSLIDKDGVASKATRSYYLRFPFAVAMPGKLWVIELQTMKYTNTTNGIKHKLEWER
jgi:uncharacterized protein